MANVNQAVNYDPLMRYALAPHDSLTLAFAAAVEFARSSSRLPGCGTFGLDIPEYLSLLDTYFPGAKPIYMSGLQPLNISTSDKTAVWDEFQDLIGLLRGHRKDDSAETRWLAHAIAACCLGEDHLWQDLGLKDRASLSEILARFFPSLHAGNTQGMRWKKYFYKLLCERNASFVCRSPSCQQCSEYANCFGPEEDASWAR